LTGADEKGRTTTTMGNHGQNGVHSLPGANPGRSFRDRQQDGWLCTGTFILDS
jgi:hypothetical protein